MLICHHSHSAWLTSCNFDEAPIKIECNQLIHAHSLQQPNETDQKSKDTYHREVNAWKYLRVCMHETNSVNFTSGIRRASGSSPLHQDVPCVPGRYDTCHRSSPLGNFQRPHICRYLIQPIDSWKESPDPHHRHQQVQLRDKIQPSPAQKFTASTPINEFHVLFHDGLLWYRLMHP